MSAAVAAAAPPSPPGRGRVHHRERAPARLQWALDAWERSGPFEITIPATGGARTAADQLKLYQQGRTTPGIIVTDAPTQASTAHGHEAAIDAHPVRELYANGAPKTVWTGDESTVLERAEARRLFGIMGEFFEALGLQWGGRFPRYDGPHIQDPQWQSLPLYSGGKIA